jgi:ParB-like chromosome segregation protein Spo0J
VKVAKQRYRVVPVADLKPHPRNPRRGNVGAIRESIRANDFYGAVIVQRSTGYVIAGRHRYEAAVEEEAAKLPVIDLDVDDETALRILLADNRTSDVAGYDEESLLALLRDVGASAATLEGTGWTFDDFQALEAELAAIGAGPLAEPDGDQSLDRRTAGRLELALGGEKLDTFLRYVRDLSHDYETHEVSDTVYECIERAWNARSS